MTERFELLDKLGAGGMADVYRARDTTTGDIVALKLLDSRMARDPGYVARFEREVEVVRRIDSPYVVKVFGYGTREGIPYIAMELVEGGSLKQLIAARGKLSWDELRPIARQVAEGLVAAHAAGVIHRDIKPSNIMLTPDGTAKLADFGISRAMDMTALTGTSTMLGTPAYMAPDLETTTSSDLYSLGVCLYEALSGEHPFKGDSQQQVLIGHMRVTPDLAKIPPESRQVVGWLLKKQPNERPKDARVLLAALSGTGGEVHMDANPLGALLAAMAVGRTPRGAAGGRRPDAGVFGASETIGDAHKRAALQATVVLVALGAIALIAGVLARNFDDARQKTDVGADASVPALSARLSTVGGSTPAGGSKTPETGPTRPPTGPTTPATGSTTPAEVAADAAGSIKKPTFEKPGGVLNSLSNYTATISTTKGDFVIDLETARAFKTSNSFAFLAEAGFFDGLVFTGGRGTSTLESGDPAGDGTGNPGYALDYEPTILKNTLGTIAMIPNPKKQFGSRFYINLRNNPQYDTGGIAADIRPPFGTVVRGIEVVQALVAGDRITKVVITDKAP